MDTRLYKGKELGKWVPPWAQFSVSGIVDGCQSITHVL